MPSTTRAFLAGEARANNVTLEEAWQEVRRVRLYPITSARLLPNRLPLAQVVRLPRVEPADRAGRPQEVAFDRISFICRAADRWGGPLTRALAALARVNLGDCRDEQPFIHVLDGEPQSHAGAIAALALLGTSIARKALVDYLLRVLAGEPNTSPAAASCAIIGLAPLQFGRYAEMSDDERSVIEALLIEQPECTAAMHAKHALSVTSVQPDPGSWFQFYSERQLRGGESAEQAPADLTVLPSLR